MRKYIWALTTILSFLNGVNLRLALVGILFKSKYDKTIRGKKFLICKVLSILSMKNIIE